MIVNDILEPVYNGHLILATIWWLLFTGLTVTNILDNFCNGNLFKTVNCLWEIAVSNGHLLIAAIFCMFHLVVIIHSFECRILL